MYLFLGLHHLSEGSAHSASWSKTIEQKAFLKLLGLAHFGNCNMSGGQSSSMGWTNSDFQSKILATQGCVTIPSFCRIPVVWESRQTHITICEDVVDSWGRHTRTCRKRKRMREEDGVMEFALCLVSKPKSPKYSHVVGSTHGRRICLQIVSLHLVLLFHQISHSRIH